MNMLSASELLLLLQAVSTLFMAGVIWVIQYVHYPLFPYAAGRDYPAFAREHGRRISMVVIPAMLIEAATAAALPWIRPAAVPAWAAWAGLALLAVVWLSTFLLQVPEHRLLLAGFDPAAHRRLLRSNRLRTAAWTLRALLLVWMLTRVGDY